MPRDKRLPHIRVADEIRERIKSGELASGDALPTISKLIDLYEVSRVTVLKALGILRDEGLIETVPRWGNFVV